MLLRPPVERAVDLTPPAIIGAHRLWLRDASQLLASGGRLNWDEKAVVIKGRLPQRAIDDRPIAAAALRVSATQSRPAVRQRRGLHEADSNSFPRAAQSL